MKHAMRNSMRKIAIPAFNNRISPLFDVSGCFAIFTADERIIGERYCIDTSGDSGFEKIERLCVESVSVIICSAISKAFAECITGKGIELFPGVIGDVDEVIKAYLSDNLTEDAFLMPGCRRRRRGAGRGLCPRYRDIDRYREM